MFVQVLVVICAFVVFGGVGVVIIVAFVVIGAAVGSIVVVFVVDICYCRG